MYREGDIQIRSKAIKFYDGFYSLGRSEDSSIPVPFPERKKKLKNIERPIEMVLARSVPEIGSAILLTNFSDPFTLAFLFDADLSQEKIR